MSYIQILGSGTFGFIPLVIVHYTVKEVVKDIYLIVAKEHREFCLQK